MSKNQFDESQTFDGSQTNEISKEQIEESPYSKRFILLMIGLCISAALIAGAIVFIKSLPEKTQSVDLVSIVNSLKDDARQRALNAGSDVKARGAILEQMQRRMNALNSVLEKQAEKCHCTILVKSAIAADATGLKDISAQVISTILKIR